MSGDLLKKWNALVSSFQGAVLTIPRCYSWSSEHDIQGCNLFGFCDESSRAYAAMVYIRVSTNAGRSVEFIVSKTRVAPATRITIPRLELLSALLLANPVCLLLLKGKWHSILSLVLLTQRWHLLGDWSRQRMEAVCAK